MITIFDDDFDKADHIGEIRKRPDPAPVPVQPPAEPPKEAPMAVYFDTMTAHVRALGQPDRRGGNPTRDAARRVLARFGRGEF